MAKPFIVAMGRTAGGVNVPLLVSASGEVTGVGGSASATVLTADPGAPANDTWWIVREGASPAMDVSLKARIAGTTYTLAAITI